MSEVFEIRHESDLSEYTSTVTDGGDLSADAEAALGSSDKGLKCVIDDTTAIYGIKEFTQITSTEYRVRFYIDPNGLTINDSFILQRTYEGNNARAKIEIQEDSDYEIALSVRDDGGTYQDTSWYSLSDAEHYIEYLVEYASSDVASDGVGTLWIDGVQQGQVTGIDLYDLSKPDAARLGPASISSGTSGTLYLDEFIFRDDDTEIGPVSVPVTVTPSALSTTWATKTPTIRGAVTVSPSVLATTWALQAPTVDILTVVSPSALAVTWATATPTIRGAATVSPSVVATTWATETPTIRGAVTITLEVMATTWALQTPTIRGAATVSPSALAVTWALQTPLAGNILILRQRTLGGDPAVTLTIGAHDLSAYVMGYFYEERAQEVGSLAIWLDNRGSNFDDLATDWPDLTRGAAVDLRRGLTIDGSDVVEKLPRTWVDSMQYIYDIGAGMLLLSCVDWWGKLERFRYASKQEWSDTEIQTIAGAMLTEVGLTLASGSFGFAIDHEIDVTEDGDQALQDLMDKVEEFLYTGLDGEIQFKALDTEESAGYSYDWSHGGGANHPLLNETEIAESSAEYNRVTVNGSGSHTGTAEDTTESGLVGTRQYTITDESLTSDAQCLERAQAELSFWQARTVAGTLVARPHFTLRLYDVVGVAAPPWGGPALSAARVTGIIERYGWGDWEQEITVGDLPEQSLLHSENRPGGRKSSRRRSSSSYYSSSYARKDHTHDTDTIADESIGEDQLVDGAVTTDKIADDAVTQDKIANNAVGNDQMRDNAIDTDELATGAVTASKLATDSVTQAKIATDAVGQAEIKDDAVGSGELKDGAVGTDHLDDGAVTSIKIAEGTISSVDLASGIISTVKIVDAAVTTAKLDDGAVTTDKIAAGAIGPSKIASQAVTQAKMADESVGYYELTSALRTLLGI